MKRLITVLLPLLLASCAHLPKRHNPPPSGFDGVVKIDKMDKNSRSLCFEGFTRIMGVHNKCQELAYQKVKPGVVRYVCADKGSKTSKNEYLSLEYFVLAVNPRTGRFISPPGPDVLPICVDPRGMLVTSERD